MTEHTQPPPMAGQHRGRARVWIAASVWLLIGGVAWVGAVAGAVASLHLSVAVANQGASADAASGGGATGFAVWFGLLAIATLGFAHVAGGISWASLGVQRRDGRRRIFGGAAGAAVLYLAAMLLADWLFHALTTSQGDGPRAYPGMGVPDAQLLAGDITSVTFGGGIWEELTLLAIPVALFTALVPLKAMGRGRRYACWSVVVVALLAARWAMHLYYGAGPAVWVVVWAGAAVGLFLASGTIWPLILAHSLYDAAAFTAARIPATNLTITWLFWAAIAAAVIVLAGTGRSWWNRTRHTPRTNLRSSGEGI